MTLVARNTPPALVDLIRELTRSFAALTVNKCHAGIIIMTYASIDILASLARPTDDEETKGEHFRHWVDRYLLPDSRLRCTSHDLWGARCGWLHTFSPESSHVRKGKAKRLRHLFECDLGLDPDKRDPQWIVVNDLFRALESGIERFVEDIEADAKLAARVTTHVAKFAEKLESWPPMSARGFSVSGLA